MPDDYNSDSELKAFDPQCSMVRKAVILAAGMGVRLKERGRQTPKGCLCLGEKPILEESIVRFLEPHSIASLGGQKAQPDGVE